MTNDSDDPLPEDSYTINAVNTISGGYVDIIITDSNLPEGAVNLNISKAFRNLNADTIASDISETYELKQGIRPAISLVTRNSSDGKSYFHGFLLERLADLGP